MKRCVIVGAGEIYSPIEIKSGDFVIAADGGYLHLRAANIVPNVIVGDFDSMDEPTAFEGIEIVKHPVEKDETDMYLAYRIGAQHGCDEFYFYGGVGGREDHTFANYCLLLRVTNENKRAFLIGNKSKTFVIKNEKIELCSFEGKGISVFAFGSDAHNVSIKGLKYEAEDITMTSSYPIGVSNSFTKGKTAEISVGDGALLIMQEM